MDKIGISKLQKDVSVICDYLKEEEKHYEEGGWPLNHIWRYVKRTKRWLRESNGGAS